MAKCLVTDCPSRGPEFDAQISSFRDEEPKSTTFVKKVRAGAGIGGSHTAGLALGSVRETLSHENMVERDRAGHQTPSCALYVGMQPCTYVHTS